MNILSFSNCPLDPRLGSGKTRRAWANGLAALGHDVHVIDSDALLGAARGRARGRRLRMAWAAWREIGGLSRIDLIEFYGAEFWLPAWRLARRSPRPLLVTHTDGLELLAAERLSASAPVNGWPRRAVDSLNRAADRLAFTSCDAFVTGCEADRRWALEHALFTPGRMEVVPLGLDDDYLKAAEAADGRRQPDAPHVAFFGSWIARKGVACIVEVMSGLLRDRLRLRLTLMGTGIPSERVLEDFPAEVRERIMVPAKLPTSECIGILSSAQVFFFPSEYEGFGLALAEAMACGCAAVTTPTGLGAELSDRSEALICPFGEKASMRAAIERLLDDDSLRSRVAAAGRERARGLQWEKSVQRLESAYLRWLGEHRHGRGAARTEEPVRR